MHVQYVESIPIKMFVSVAIYMCKPVDLIPIVLSSSLQI